MIRALLSAVRRVISGRIIVDMVKCYHTEEKARNPKDGTFSTKTAWLLEPNADEADNDGGGRIVFRSGVVQQPLLPQASTAPYQPERKEKQDQGKSSGYGET